MTDEIGTWGQYGKEPPCTHLLALRDFLLRSGVGIWGEDREWVNISCERCHRTYEDALRGPMVDQYDEDEDEDEA